MARTGRPSLYPWDTWLDGTHRLLLPGEHFAPHVNLDSLRQQIYAAATQRGKKATVNVYAEGLAVRALASDEPARRGRVPLQKWDEVFAEEKLIDFEEIRDYPQGRAEAFQITLRRAARRHGAVVQTRRVGRRVTCNILRAAKKPEEFLPPVIFDEGQDEDSVFEAVDYEWDGENGGAA